MSSRASPISPVTGRGAFLLAVSAAVLAVGVLRVDLAALFWGAAFLLLCLYGTVGGAVFRLLLGRAVRSAPSFLTVLLSPPCLAVGEEGAAAIRAVLPRAFVPGFTVRLLLPLSWHGRSLDVAVPLAPGGNDCRTAFRAPRRGRYGCSAAYLELRDVLGISRIRLAVPLAESLRVAPRLDPDAAPDLPRAEGGEAVHTARRRRRSEELLETRKYVPGDDPRRINWKLYAHMRELFLRVGEETPPPDSRILLLLDTTENRGVPAAAADPYLDGLVEACGNAALAAIRGGAAVLLARTGFPELLPLGEEGGGDLRAALSEAWWTPAGAAVPQEAFSSLPSGPGTHAVVFSTPGSPALEGLLAALAARGWGVSLAMKDLALPAPAGRRPPAEALRSLLFLTAHAAARGDRPARGAAFAFRERLEAEAARFRGPPWRLTDVRSV